jgi:hypothetical protein
MQQENVCEILSQPTLFCVSYYSLDNLTHRRPTSAQLMRERELRRREGHEGRVLQMNSVELTPEEVGASVFLWSLLIGRWWLLVYFA